MTLSDMTSNEALFTRIRKQLADHPIMLYMKGDKNFPQCGFSARVVQVLDELGVTYETHDVLSDPELRSQMKTFSQWPTFPQLFVKGELVGGCDIVTAMYESGELQSLLKDRGVSKA